MNMENRQIEKVLTPENFMWVGDAFYTTSFVGRGEISRERMDPFFAVGYNPDKEFSPREIPRGVGAHPHKGFETVTLAYKGQIEHKDSRGNHGVIGEGDVQWMTAGAGLLHQEYHEKEFSKAGGLFQMVQMWVNLPAKDKETPPKYQDLRKNDMTKVALANNGGHVDVIAGEYLGQKGKGTTFSPMNLYNAYFNKEGKGEFKFPTDFNTAILVIEGAVKVNDDRQLNKDSFAMFVNESGDTFELEATKENTIVLVMSGQPLKEPVAHYGPFVMNTEEQIQQAIMEFQSGKFGNL